MRVRQVITLKKEWGFVLLVERVITVPIPPSIMSYLVPTVLIVLLAHNPVLVAPQVMRALTPISRSSLHVTTEPTVLEDRPHAQHVLLDMLVHQERLI